MENFWGVVAGALSTYRVPLLTVAIVAGYLWSLAVLLRGERYLVRLILFLLVALALGLRLIAPKEFPPGMNEDEPKVLACALDALKDRQLHTEGCTGVPFLLNVLFQAQLVPVLGPNRESMRFYSVATGSLSIPVAYALARAVHVSSAASLVYASMVATLPWSLYYGRVSWGAGLTFHELLLLAALARIVFGHGGWREVFIAALGQSLLLYDYFAGRLFVPFLGVAFILARGRRKLLIVATLVIASAAWLPYLLSNPQHLLVPRGDRPHLEWSALVNAARATLEAFVWPRAADFWISVRSAAVHPLLILVLAALGVIFLLVRQPRLVLFLFGGFLVGLAPAMGTLPSTRRMMTAYPFVGLLAAHALDRLPLGRRRGLAFAIVAAAIGLASVRFYFSEEFWPPQSRDVSGAGITQLVEAIPYPARSKVVISPGSAYFFAVRERTDRGRFEVLDTENWWPQAGSGVTYAYSAHWELLEPFYRGIFGPQRVRSFGGPFSVTFEPADWTWLRQYGWAYEVECASPSARWSSQVPALFHLSQTVPQFSCAGGVVHRWKGRWVSDGTELRFRFERGTAEVALEAEGTVLPSEKGPVDFRVRPGDVISIFLRIPDPEGPIAFLFEISPAGEVIPPWRSVKPER
ncbi:hypothetical protein HRbin30_02789 [bacterium HR30]|nr:hypothetical protein HRbin30_02789 [bacterium HR30]